MHVVLMEFSQPNLKVRPSTDHEIPAWKISHHRGIGTHANAQYPTPTPKELIDTCRLERLDQHAQSSAPPGHVQSHPSTQPSGCCCPQVLTKQTSNHKGELLGCCTTNRLCNTLPSLAKRWPAVLLGRAHADWDCALLGMLCCLMWVWLPGAPYSQALTAPPNACKRKLTQRSAAVPAARWLSSGGPEGAGNAVDGGHLRREAWAGRPDVCPKALNGTARRNALPGLHKCTQGHDQASHLTVKNMHCKLGMSMPFQEPRMDTPGAVPFQCCTRASSLVQVPAEHLATHSSSGRQAAWRPCEHISACRGGYQPSQLPESGRGSPG